MYKERGMGKNGESQKCGYHFNLYAIDKDGNEVLMTKDHILAKARGGKDRISNYQTCCKVCNETKGATNNEVFKELIEESPTKSGHSILQGQLPTGSKVSLEQSVARMNRKDLPFEMPINEQSENSITENDTCMTFETECSDIKITRTK